MGYICRLSCDPPSPFLGCDIGLKLALYPHSLESGAIPSYIIWSFQAIGIDRIAAFSGWHFSMRSASEGVLWRGLREIGDLYLGSVEESSL